MTPLTKIWSFCGRIGRADYFFGFIFNIIVGAATFALAFVLLQSVLGMPQPEPEARWVYVVIFGFGLFFFFWLHLALSAKRFHDLGRSGWFVLILLVPILGTLVWLYLLFARGEDGDNDYGPAR